MRSTHPAGLRVPWHAASVQAVCASTGGRCARQQQSHVKSVVMQAMSTAEPSRVCCNVSQCVVTTLCVCVSMPAGV